MIWLWFCGGGDALCSFFEVNESYLIYYYCHSLSKLIGDNEEVRGQTAQVKWKMTVLKKIQLGTLDVQIIDRWYQPSEFHSKYKLVRLQIFF